MATSVWLLARPLSAANLFPPFESTSNGKYHLCHWGVLITDISIPDMNVLLSRTKQDGRRDTTKLGVLYELLRFEGNQNIVNIARPFTALTVREQWRTFSSVYIGKTKLTQEKIEQEGSSSIANRTNGSNKDNSWSSQLSSL